MRLVRQVRKVNKARRVTQVRQVRRVKWVRQGLRAILAEYGYQAVGSYAMRTMTWRDLDYERPEESPDWPRHWEIGTQLAATGWCVRLNCVNHYWEGWYLPGLYWGLRVADPRKCASAAREDPTVWKMDLWSLPAEGYHRGRAQCEAWLSQMTEESRALLLAIKARHPDYRRSLLSVHVYEGVLEHGAQSEEEFRVWWEGRHGGGEGDAG